MKYAVYAVDLDGKFKRHGETLTRLDARLYKDQLKERGLKNVGIFRKSDGQKVY
jgi:hypothetical protein